MSEGTQGAEASEVQARPHDKPGPEPHANPRGPEKPNHRSPRNKVVTADHQSDLHDTQSVTEPDAVGPNPVNENDG